MCSRIIRDERSQIPAENGELPKGFEINRIVFTYLDYLLAVDAGALGFRFNYRNSVEHFYPQSIDHAQAGNYVQLKDEQLKDLFGNLALVTISDNSKFSNSPPKAKIGFRTILDQSPEAEADG